MKKKTDIVKMTKDGRVYDVPAYRVSSRKLHGYQIVEESKKASKADTDGGK